MTKIVELRPNSVYAQLRKAQQERTLVRIWREKLEPGSFTGYVGATGGEHFLLWALGDYIGFDGHFVLRYRDVTRLESPDHHADFLEKAMVLRQLRPEFPMDLPIDDFRETLKAAATQAPVTSVYVDSEAENEVCYIGQLLGFENDGFNIQEVSPHAEWLRDASYFDWNEVSCISWNEPYALALAEVAGPPPSAELIALDTRTKH